MINALRVGNFKSLRDTGDMPIRPLTFLVGPNSSGKRSVIQMLLMLKQTVESTGIDNPLVANGPWVQSGAYPDFVYGKDYASQLSVSMRATYPEGRTLRDDRPVVPECAFSAQFSYNRKTTQIVLEKAESSLDRWRTLIERVGTTKKYVATMPTPGTDDLQQTLRAGVMIPKKFYSIAPRELVKGSKVPRLSVHVFSISIAVESIFKKMHYIGPLRDYPKRFYVTSGQSPQDVGSKGERAVDVLWFAHRSSLRSVRKTERQVEQWLARLGMARAMRLDRVSGANYYQLTVKDPASDIESNLVDIGFGASQTLPIVVECLYSGPGSTILMEQPEIHLHPRAQSVLGDMFIEASSAGQRTLIVETHSEHILDRVRRRIAEGTLSSDDVSILYFEPSASGTRVSQVQVNDLGQYVSFPDGFFDEDYQEAIAHLQAIASEGQSAADAN